MTHLQHVAGSFKVEAPHLREFFAIPSCAIYVREKSYLINVLHKRTPESETMIGKKLAARGSIPKPRAKKYSLKDYFRMANNSLPQYAEDLVSLRATRNLNMYEVSFKRKEATTFTRKRFVLRNGLSHPFHFHLNKTLDAQQSVPPVLEDDDCDMTD